MMMHTPAPSPAAHRQEIVALQQRDGGWGAGAGSISNSECTALACIALDALGDGSAGDPLVRGRQWLVQRQESNGAWRYSEQTPDTPWPTPIALLALLRSGASTQAVDRGFEWLLGAHGVQISWLTRIRLLLAGTPPELDASLAGWSWAPDTFSWVEPTSWALMALKARWPDDRPRQVRHRIRDGEALLIDRSCVGGGWNYGNRQVFGEELPPYPDTTALGLLALRGTDHPVVAESFDALDLLLRQSPSLLSLSLAVLSRRAWARPVDDLLPRLADRQSEGTEADHRSLLLSALASAPRLDWLQGPAS